MPREKSLDHQKLIQELFELSPTASSVFNIITGQNLILNRAFEAKLGLSKDQFDAGGVSFKDLFAVKADAEEFTDQIKSREVVRRAEVKLLDKEGREFQGLASGRILKEIDPAFFEFSFTDISRQKKLQQALRREYARTASLIDNLTAGLFLVDNSGVVTEANFDLANIVDVEQDLLVGQPHSRLTAELIRLSSEPEVLQHTLETAILNVMEKPAVEFALIRDYQVSYYELTIFPVRDDGGLPVGWGGLLQDITDLRAQTIWKLELLSMLAHDIRSPLATLKGHATALLGNYQNWGSEMVGEFLEAIDRSTDDLIRQVDRNLALTRVETGKLGLRPQAVKPVELIDQALERSASLLEDVPVERNIPDGLPDVRVDPARIEEVLINLIENGVKYGTPSQGLLMGVEEKRTHLHFYVQDFGSGIPLEDQQKIFEKYEQGKSANQGMGLGLFISRKIVEDHGGMIDVQSPAAGLDHGTRFTFSVPVLAKVEVPEERRSASPRSADLPDMPAEELISVLVVDDEPDFLALYRSILSSDAYELDVASDGRTAIKISQVSSPDIILLDWVLPDVDGISVCRQIRRWSDVPIIMITSRSAQEDVIAALDAGADDYLIKPFLGDELIARIKAILRRGESLRDKKLTDRFSKKGLVIDYNTREAWVSGEKLALTATEFDLLEFFSRNQKQILKYQQIIEHIWQGEEGGTRHALSVQISRLRKKIEPDPDNPAFLVTRWGVGYVFLPEE